MTTDWYARQAASFAFAERWRGCEPIELPAPCPPAEEESGEGCEDG